MSEPYSVVYDFIGDFSKLTEGVYRLAKGNTPVMEHAKPSVGRIVHYVLSSQDGTMEHKAGQHRPAIIVHVWGENEKASVQLQVFTDGTNDRLDERGMVWVTSVVHDEDEKKGRTWHWPERE